jgi:hypothetical protein
MQTPATPITTAKEPILPPHICEAIAVGRLGDPFAWLGLRATDKGLRIACFDPGASHAWIVNAEGGKVVALERVHPAGVFAALLPHRKRGFDYRLAFHGDGRDWSVHDPYAFGPVLGDLDVHLLAEGSHQELYRRLGAHPVEHEGTAGTAFAVWAPNARRDGRIHAYRTLPVMEHPYDSTRLSWGLSADPFSGSITRRPARFGDAGGLHRLRRACHDAGLGVIARLGPGPFPVRSAWACPIRRHRALRARGSALGLPQGLEHADLQLRPARGVELPARQRAVLARALGIDGLRVDAVASMLYLDYSRRPGEWVPNLYGGRENLEAIAFLREVNRLVYARAPGRIDDRRGIDGLAGVSASTDQGGLGFSYKWNMGWMHDTLRITCRRNRSTEMASSP